MARSSLAAGLSALRRGSQHLLLPGAASLAASGHLSVAPRWRVAAAAAFGSSAFGQQPAGKGRGGKEPGGASGRRKQPLAAAPAPAPAPSGGSSSPAVVRAAPAAAGERLIDTDISDEAQGSYLAYAMSVIVGRALPDVRDGLKPVHRRILYAMHELGLRPAKPFRKSARVVGEVLGKYHPHGDTAVYDALVRLAQDFSMSAPLVSGHGNFGSLDADPPAAMRYTECRLQQLTDAMLLQDLSEATVAYGPTFDDSLLEPLVLPARLPNLLLNGSQGIAVGMATSFAPHNLRELAEAVVLVARNPEATVEEILRVMPGPDFPTGGEMVGTAGVEAAYRTGSGSVTIRGKVAVEEIGAGKKARQALVIKEVPYMGNKATLVARIAELVDDGTLKDVADIRDESDRDGVRVVVELKRGADPEQVAAALFFHTKLQTTFKMNMIALLGNQPRTWNVREILRTFVDFRCEVIRKRADAELKEAAARAHIVDGLRKALAQIDRAIAIIRGAKDGAAASALLKKDLGLSDEQAAAVLAMPLRRLTALETGKLEEEGRELAAKIADLKDLLAKQQRVVGVLVEETEALKRAFGQPRRTAIVAGADGAGAAGGKAAEARQREEAVADEPVLIIVSERGYVKRMRPEEFQAQNRGTRGKGAGRLRADDALLRVLSASARDRVLLFTERGRVFGVPAFEIPEGSRTSGGTPLPQLVGLAPGEAVTAVVTVRAEDLAAAAGGAEGRSATALQADSLVMLTEQGFIKRTPLAEFASIRSNGIRAAALEEGDKLLFVSQAKEGDTVLVGTSKGRVLHFPVDQDNLRPMSRTARGVRASSGGHRRMSESGNRFVGLVRVPRRALPASVAAAAGAPGSESEGDASDAEFGGSASGMESDSEETLALRRAAGPWVLFVTQKGFAKRVPITEFSVYSRGTTGKIGCKFREPEDRLAALRLVPEEPPAAPPPPGEFGSAAAALAARQLGAAADPRKAGLSDEVVIASEGGVLNRCRVRDVSVYGRYAKGSRLMRLDQGDRVRGLCLVEAEEEEEDVEEEGEEEKS